MSKEATKQRILEVANQLFSDKGYSGTTIREIAIKANVNELTVFRHFGNKEQLFQEIVAHISTIRNITEYLDPLMTDDLQTDLTMLANTFFEMVLRDLTRIKLAHIESPSNPILREAATQFPNQLRIFLSNYFTRLQQKGKIREDNYDMLAEIFFSAIFQRVLAKCDFPSGDIMRNAAQEEIVETIVSLYTNSLSKAK